MAELAKKEGKPLNKTMIRDHYLRAIHAIGIDETERRRRKLTFHAWRHWYNSYLRGRIPDHALRQLTRHKNEALTDRYSHVTEEQREAIREVGDELLEETL